MYPVAMRSLDKLSRSGFCFNLTSTLLYMCTRFPEFNNYELCYGVYRGDTLNRFDFSSSVGVRLFDSGIGDCAILGVTTKLPVGAGTFSHHRLQFKELGIRSPRGVDVAALKLPLKVEHHATSTSTISFLFPVRLLLIQVTANWLVLIQN